MKGEKLKIRDSYNTVTMPFSFVSTDPYIALQELCTGYTQFSMATNIEPVDDCIFINHLLYLRDIQVASGSSFGPVKHIDSIRSKAAGKLLESIDMWEELYFPSDDSSIENNDTDDKVKLFGDMILEMLDKGNEERKNTGQFLLNMETVSSLLNNLLVEDGNIEDFVSSIRPDKTEESSSQ